MSNVTTVLLSPGECHKVEGPVIAELNARLAALLPSGSREAEIPDYWALKPLSETAEAWGGSKWPPALYGGALNNLPFADFARLAAELPWSNPARFQVMAMLGGDDRYRVLTLADLRDWPEG